MVAPPSTVHCGYQPWEIICAVWIRLSSQRGLANVSEGLPSTDRNLVVEGLHQAWMNNFQRVSPAQGSTFSMRHPEKKRCKWCICGRKQVRICKGCGGKFICEGRCLSRLTVAQSELFVCLQNGSSCVACLASTLEGNHYGGMQLKSTRQTSWQSQDAPHTPLNTPICSWLNSRPQAWASSSVIDESPETFMS